MVKLDLSSITLEQLPDTGHPFQSLYWAYLKKNNGWKPFAFQLECKELQVSEKFLVLTRTIAPLFHIAYIPFSPLSVELFSTHNGYFQQLSKKIAKLLPSQPIFIRYDFPFTFDNEQNIIVLKGRRVRTCSQSVQPEATEIIPLEDGYEVVSSRYRQRAKRAIRKVVDSDIEIIEYENDQALFDSWYELYKETAKRDGFSMRPKRYIYHLLHEPKVKHSSSLIVATYKNMIVGGIITISTKEVAVYLLGASKRIRGISPSYLLQDYSIRKACEQKCSYYDLHGIAGPFEKGAHLGNLTLFKQAFGGKSYYRPPSTDYVNRAPLYALYRLFEKMRYLIHRKSVPAMNTQQYSTTQDN